MTKIIDPLGGRECLICHQHLPRDMFYKHPTGLNGLGSRCKTCCYDYGKKPEILARKKQLYQHRKSYGQCVKCGIIAMNKSLFCRECWFADRASSRCGSTDFTEIITEAWMAQEGKCYYTGEELSMTDGDASLDHQTPVSRGGSNSSENLRWIKTWINCAKGSMTHAEFIRMCHYITKKFVYSESIPRYSEWENDKW